MRGLSSLRGYRTWSQDLPPAAALGSILDHLGILPLAVTRETGETRAGNLLKVVEIGFRDAGKVANSFPELVDRLAGFREGAEAVLSEAPFSVTREREGLPRTTTGTVDVAFREADGWVLADYKTDAVDGNLEALVNHYRSQVETYRACWEEITGEAVKETLLYFIRLDETVSG